MAEHSFRCPDCGEYPVNHKTEWVSALFDSVFMPVSGVFDRIAGAVFPSGANHLFDGWSLAIFRAAAALRLGTLKSGPDGSDSARNRMVWEAARQRGIALWQFRVLGRPDGINFFVAQRREKTILFEGLPRPGSGKSKSLDWMDNKATLKHKFTAAGIPMARGRACFTFGGALRTMRAVGVPVIAKPHIGSRSRHTTVDIATPEALATAFHKANQLSPLVIIEQQLQGSLFRILLVAGKLTAVCRREPPHVVGDGVSTVRELAVVANRDPRRAGPVYHTLPLDVPVDWSRVPAKGEMFNLDTHVSRFYGGTTTDFTDRLHPDNRTLFEHIAEVLGDSLVGVDFIMGDMERSWRDQDRCGVIECNSLPNIDLHQDVFSGENRDIAGMLFEQAFS